VLLPTYLAAKGEVIEAERNRTTRQRDEYEAAGVYVGDLEKVNNRLHNLAADLELTKNVAEAAQISLR